jgi:hypothetical protein
MLDLSVNQSKESELGSRQGESPSTGLCIIWH